MEQTKRQLLWDNYKFILILLVVIGHSANAFTTDYPSFKAIFIFIYAFHMPAFIFISGYFHKNTNISGKIYGFLALGMLTSILLFIIDWITKGETSINFFATSELPWYLFVLAGFIAFTYFTRKINPLLLLIISAVIACFTGFDSSIGDFLYVSRFLVFLPFYLCGYCLANSEKRNQFLHALKTIWAKILGCAVIVAWAVLCIFKLDVVYTLRPLFTGRNPFPENLISYGALYRLLCMLIAFVLIFAFYAIIPNKKIPFVSNAGKNTLTVYAFHLIVRNLLLNLCAIDVFTSTSSGKLIWILIAVIVTIVFSLNLFSKPLNAFMRAVKPKQGHSGN